MDCPLVLPKVEDTLEDFLTNHTSLRFFRAMLDSDMPRQVAPTHWLGAMWAARHHACYKGFCQDLANAVLWKVNERFFQQKFDIFCSDASLKTTTGKQDLLQELVLINLVHNSHVLFQIGISLISLATVFTLKHFLFSVGSGNVPAKTLRVKVLLAKLTLGFPCKQKPQSPTSRSWTRSCCKFWGTDEVEYLRN